MKHRLLSALILLYGLGTAPLSAQDCNGNGVPDATDIANNVSMDCNGNGVPDECDVASGTSPDCNGNGLPDECDINNNQLFALGSTGPLGTTALYLVDGFVDVMTPAQAVNAPGFTLVALGEADMATEPDSQTLWAVMETQEAGQVLFTIDKLTAVATAQTTIDPAVAIISIAFDGDGTLFAVAIDLNAFPQPVRLYEIDRQSGAATQRQNFPRDPFALAYSDATDLMYAFMPSETLCLFQVQSATFQAQSFDPNDPLFTIQQTICLPETAFTPEPAQALVFTPGTTMFQWLTEFDTWRGDVNPGALSKVIFPPFGPSTFLGLAWAQISTDYDQDAVPDECQPFQADVNQIRLSTGGTQNFTLDAGAARAGDSYWIFGSGTGTSPGIDFGGGIILPLVPDAYYNLTLTKPFAAPFVNFLANLDGQGQATAAVQIPADPSLAGITLYHAFVTAETFGVVDGASNFMPLTLIP